MKGLVLLFVLTFSVTALAWEAREEWNNELDQEMLLNCDTGDSVCLKTCGDEFQCRVPAGLCKNCIGTGTLLSYFYQEVGRWFVSTSERISEDAFSTLLKQQNFIILTYDSPYNIFTPIRDHMMERSFNSLCPGKPDAFPVVIGSLNNKKELSSISAVICHGDDGAEIFRIKAMPNVDMGMIKDRLFSLELF